MRLVLKKLQKKILKYFFVIVFFVFSIPTFCLAQQKLAARDLINDAKNYTFDTATETGVKLTDVNDVVGRVINDALALVGSVFFLLMIYGGVL
jgi:hypothetical protein